MGSFFDNFIGEQQAMIRETASQFGRQEIRPHVEAWEEAGSFPRKLYRQAAEVGLLGVGFSEEVGGSGGGALDQVMAIEGLMEGGSMGVAAGLGSLGIAVPPIIAQGGEALIDEVVRPAFAGEKICALAITEPNTGSDVAGVATRAERDGDVYVIDGAKTYITSGVRADYLTVLARTGDDPHGGLSFFVIDADAPGVGVSKPLKKHGWWASDTAELHFEEVEVPVARRVGPEGWGFIGLMQNFQRERLALAAYGVATARLALEEALEYSADRQAFGRPIAKFQVNRHKLVDMKTRIMSVQTFVYQVAMRMDRQEYRVQEVSMAKNLAAQLAVDVCYEAVQLHGGMGYMRESLVERLSRDARLLPIGGGTQEIMKEIIAREMKI